MLDINKATTSPNDPEGHMYGLEPWSPQVAMQLAEAEGLVLSDGHWAIINYLRDRYCKYGDAKNAREIAGELEEKFTDGRGRSVLYELFPGGPVSQGSRIAGLPLPPYSGSLSLGSVK